MDREAILNEMRQVVTLELETEPRTIAMKLIHDALRQRKFSDTEASRIVSRMKIEVDAEFIAGDVEFRNEIVGLFADAIVKVKKGLNKISKTLFAEFVKNGEPITFSFRG